MEFLLGALVLVVVAAVAVVVMQRRHDGPPDHAAQLLTQFQTVSGQVPDDAASTRRILEAITRETGASRSTLFVDQDGRFTPYAAIGADDGPFPDLPPAVVEAAHEDRPLDGLGLLTGRGVHEATVPLTLGARVVGIVALQRTDGPFDRTVLTRIARSGHDAALRIAIGLLLADVRRAATAEERRRLAREIHDGVAQDLASVGYSLDALVTDLAGNPNGHLAEQIRAQVRGIVSELRLSIVDLRADIQPGVGLGTTLTDYVQQAGSLSGLTVHLVIDEGGQRLPVAQETELLRIAQEAVTNVRRHAAADNLWVTYRVEPPGAYLSVADDGQGMDSPRNDSFGLDIMQERAQRIGARMSWHPRHGGGTVLEVVVQPPAEREE